MFLCPHETTQRLHFREVVFVLSVTDVVRCRKRKLSLFCCNHLILEKNAGSRTTEGKRDTKNCVCELKHCIVDGGEKMLPLIDKCTCDQSDRAMILEDVTEYISFLYKTNHTEKCFCISLNNI